MNDGMNAMVLLCDPIPTTLTPAAWWDNLTALTTLEELVPWAIGKYLAFAKNAYCTTNGTLDRAAWREWKDRVSGQTGKSISRLENICSTFSHWPEGCPIELEGLTFAHFEEVDRFSDDKELALFWLDSAKANGWSAKELGFAISGDKATQQRQQQELQRLLQSGSWTVNAVTGGWVRLRDGSRELDCKISEWRIEQ